MMCFFTELNCQIETGKPVCSYVESTENIRARANFSNDMFHNSPNAQDTMYVKFVLNRAYDYLKILEK